MLLKLSDCKKSLHEHVILSHDDTMIRLAFPYPSNLPNCLRAALSFCYKKTSSSSLSSWYWKKKMLRLHTCVFYYSIFCLVPIVIKQSFLECVFKVHVLQMMRNALRPPPLPSLKRSPSLDVAVSYDGVECKNEQCSN